MLKDLVLSWILTRLTNIIRIGNNDQEFSERAMSWSSREQRWRQQQFLEYRSLLATSDWLVSIYKY